MNVFSFEKIDSKKALRIQIVIASLIILGIISMNITPVEMIINLSNGDPVFQRVPDTCSMNVMFGIPCPMCGMSRGFKELLRFNVMGSLYYNPFSVFLFPMGFIAVSTVLIASFFKYKLKIVNSKLFWIGVLTLLALIWTANIIWGNH